MSATLRILMIALGWLTLGTAKTSVDRALPRDTARRFLDAWKQGKGDEMWGCLDSKTRSLISKEEFARMLGRGTIETGNGCLAVERTGLIAGYSSLHVEEKPGDFYVATARIHLTYQSLSGVNEMVEMRHARSEWHRALIALCAALARRTIDTSKGEETSTIEMTLQNGRRAALRVRGYVLVNESGKWVVSKALDVE